MPAYLKPVLYVLAGALAATLLTTTSALAGSGVGATFNLGQTNTVNGTSVLTGSSSGPQLKVLNSSSANHGILAQSGGGAGVGLYSQHTSVAGVGPAIRGDSASTAVGAFSVYGLLSPTAPGANSAALRGESKATNANGYGVWGSQAGAGTGVYGTSSTGTGVLGRHSAGSGTAAGVQGLTNANAANAMGVYGLVTSTTPGQKSAAVRGENKGTGLDGYGVWGSQAGNGTGVYGSSYGGKGVFGETTVGNAVYGQTLNGESGVTGSSGGGFGVIGSSNDRAGVVGEGGTGGIPVVSGVGVEGIGATRGVFGQSSQGFELLNGIGVLGNSAARGVVGVLANASCDGTYAVGGCGTTSGYGVLGRSTNTDGVHGESTDGYGVLGRSTSTDGVHGASSTGYGVYGHSASNDAVRGESGGGSGVLGQSTDGVGVYGYSVNSSAGYFEGDVTVSGTLSKGAGAFKIDHPLDPAHKYLQHSFVESPDMMNVYNGNIVTDGKGFATVELPTYFQALNREFRYQLTIVGTRGWNARVVKEIAHNRFTIQTDQPKVRVSWQVTGIRHDSYANAHRIQVIVPKAAAERGKYLHPGLYGQPRSKAIGAEFRRAPRQTVRPAR